MMRALSLVLLCAATACSGESSDEGTTTAGETQGTSATTSSGSTAASAGSSTSAGSSSATTSASSVGSSGATGTGGITTATTSVGTGGPDPCTVHPEATCTLTPGCMAVDGRPFVPNRDTMGHCLGPAEFIACMTEAACPPVVLTLCKTVGLDEPAYEVASGCQPETFEPCDPPDMVTGDCP